MTVLDKALVNPKRFGVGKRRSKASGRTIAITAIVFIVIYLVVGPLAMLIYSSFRETQGNLPFEEGASWTLDNYIQVFFSASTYEVMGTTLLYAVGALIISFGMALTMAWFIERTNMPGKAFVSIMVIASLGLPGVIFSIAWVLLLSPRSGVLNLWFRDIFGLELEEGPLNIYTLLGMTFVQGVSLVPITFLLVAAAFKAADASVEEASATSGARFGRTMRLIAIPLLAPALLSAAVYQFVSVIESFDVPLVIGLPGGVRVLSTEIFTYAAPAGGLPNFGQSSAYAILLILIALGPLLVYNHIIKHSDRYATLSGHSHRSKKFDLGGWKWVALFVNIVFIMFSFGLPALVMFWTAIQPFYSVPSAESIARISFEAFENLLTDTQFIGSLGNTFILGAATGLVTMILGLLVAWVLVRTRSKWRTPLDVLAFTPHAMPGIIIALSVLLIYIFLPIPIYGTIWIMVVALATQWLALSSRLMTGGIAQIRADLEEVAATSGAGWTVTIRKIVLPLVLPAFVNGFVLIFLMAIKNLTIPLILATPRSNVLSTTIWQAWENGDTARTAAMGVVMVVITLIIALIYRRVSKWADFTDKI